MLIARFKYCNKNCLFCDTNIKMRTSIEGNYSINDLNIALQKTRGLMISGGEPTFNSKLNNNLDQTINMMKYCDCQIINIETNGYQLEELLNNTVNLSNFESNASIFHFMYSPKIVTEKDYEIELEKTENLINNPYVFLKIVAEGTPLTEKFIKEVSTLTKNKGKIYLMPLGVTSEEISKNWKYCVDLADDVNINISTRMHIMHSYT